MIIIGDAGAPDLDGEPVLDLLAKTARSMSEKTTILFLGDNIYNTGLPLADESDISSIKKRKDKEKIIDIQLTAAAQSGSRAIFIPGNHDWDNSGSEGLIRIKEQASYISAQAGKDPISMLPDQGCPGPEYLPLGASAAVIIIDSQWFLHPFEKGCSTSQEKAIFETLSSLLDTAKKENRIVMLAMHHPVLSHSRHGGFYDWKSHLFPLRSINKSLWIPLPIIGSIHPLLRSYRSLSITDISNPQYQRFISNLTNALRLHPGLPKLVASGHDHGLQVIRNSDSEVFSYQLVSGLGSHRKASEVSSGENTLFAHSSSSFGGFMLIDFYQHKEAIVWVIETIPDEESSKKCLEIRPEWLPTGGCVVFTHKLVK